MADKKVRIAKVSKDGNNKNRFPIFPVRFNPDDMTTIRSVIGQYTLKNIASTIRLCIRVIVQLQLSVNEIKRLNAEYEAAHKDCIRITIGQSGD